MTSRRRGGAGVLAVWLMVAISPMAHAQELDEIALTADEPAKTRSFWERFRLGGTVSFMSGLDRIRSKSSNVISFRDIQINSGAIVFEPRVNAGDGRISMSPVFNDNVVALQFNVVSDFIRDPRLDTGVRQDTSLEETLWGVLNAAYDLKTWRHGTLFVQFDAGHYRGDAGNIEVAIDLADQPILNPVDQDITADDPLANFQFIYPSAGRLKQTPLSLSGLWQFRPRSPFRPYIGVGLGYMFASLDSSESLAIINEDLAGINYTFRVRGALLSEGVLPAETIVTEVNEAFLWTAQGGLEYNINRKWSVFVDARFIQTAATVKMRVKTSDGKEFIEFGQGIQRSESVEDVAGIGTVDALLKKLLDLPVEDAVELIADIAERSFNPPDNERSFFGSFPVLLGTELTIVVPNPVNGEGVNQSRQTKLFVQGGNLDLDSFSLGVGFRYRY